MHFSPDQYTPLPYPDSSSPTSQRDDRDESDNFLTRSEQNSEDPGEISRYIWGTLININDVMHRFNTFIKRFELQSFKVITGEYIKDSDMMPLYPTLFDQVYCQIYAYYCILYYMIIRTFFQL